MHLGIKKENKRRKENRLMRYAASVKEKKQRGGSRKC